MRLPCTLCHFDDSFGPAINSKAHQVDNLSLNIINSELALYCASALLVCPVSYLSCLGQNPH